MLDDQHTLYGKVGDEIGLTSLYAVFLMFDSNNTLLKCLMTSIHYMVK